MLLVSIDTLRADHLGLYGYERDTSPVIDALGAEGAVFENAIVQWPVTTPSMASMFSGEYPHVTGVVISAGTNFLPPRLLMLAEALQERDFRTSAVVSNGVLGRANNFGQGFETYRELWMNPGPHATQTDATRVTDAAIEELTALAERGDRFLLWVHYIDPHSPYDPPEGYAERYVGDALYQRTDCPVNADDDPWRGMPRSLVEKAGGENDLGRFVAAYDGEIRYADTQLGRLLERLETLPAGEETLVVLVSDHGESLGEHDHYFNHGHVPYEEQVRVPLIFRWPDRRYAGTRVEDPVETRGLARTLLAALGIADADNPFLGANLLAAMQTGEARGLPPNVYSLAGADDTRQRRSYTVAMRRGDLKLVLPRSEWARARHDGIELYDLSTDPQERRDLAPERSDVATDMRQGALSWFFASKPWPHTHVPSEQLVDDRTAHALRELGYAK